MTLPNSKPEVDLRRRGRHLEKWLLRHCGWSKSDEI